MTFTTLLRESGVASIRAWLPTQRQVRAAIGLDLAAAIDGDELLQHDLEGAPATTMQQALGLVFVCGLVAGLVPFFFNWITATRAGTSTMLLSAARQLDAVPLGSLPLPFQIVANAVQTAAGADPIFPGWLAAFLSALGEWINWPLNFLTLWIAYGILALTLAKFFGALTTLQRFFAASGYAAIPLVLLGLSIVPWIGPLIALAGILLSLLFFYRALRHVTELPTFPCALSTILPPAIALMAVMLVAASVAISALRFLW